MAKNLIIGGFTNYNYNQLKPWVESIDECGFTGDKVLAVGNTTEETIRELLDRKFILIDIPNDLNIPIHVARFIFIYEYLVNHWQQYEFIITTDVKDVYFQKNPVEWLRDNLKENYKLVAGSESLLYMDEPWGDDNLKNSYGPYVYELYKNKIIYNVGTIGGYSEYVKDMIFNIFTNAVNRPIPICDQAVYNVLINTQPFKDITYFADQCDGWAVQAGTTADPSKIENFRKTLIEAEPQFVDGLILTGQDSLKGDCKKGTPFTIVHQYDRVPEWKQNVMKKYKLEDLIVIRT
jgi:hypothetical protein